ncbi:CHAP domain-containing protein [Ruminococcaceae bacterium AM07-15]|nr:CHAP domain-containing protein [Ruminococcaceae bacterium AM07-15]
MNKKTRLRFTEEERADPALEKPIRKVDKAAAKADKAQAKIPKKQVRQKTVDPETGKVTTKLVLEDKKKPPSKLSHAVRDTPANAVLGKVHKEIRETEQDNVGVESAHKSEEAAETGARLMREGYRSHKLKPYRKAAQAEQKLEKANVNALYQKSLRENPQLASNPISRWQQKQAIKKEYAAAKRAGQAAGNTASTAKKTGKAAKTVKEKAQEAGAFVVRHKKGFLIAGAIFLLVCMLLNTMSSCSMMAQSIGSVVSGTTYPSDDPELVAVEADYAAKETALQAEIDNIESSHPGYDEYQYDLDMIGHDPHELAAYLSAVLQGYTQESAQAELERVFSAQYTLTLTEEVQIRTYTDEDGDEHEYEYRILHVKLESRPISSVATELLTPDQLEMYQVYRQTLGNKLLIFGGGSPDTSDSEDLTGVVFVNGTRPGNQAVVDIAKSQVGNVGGQPYWSWYGFNSRVEWCACFVSWCYNQMGLSEPRFAACQSQGIPWFQSHGQWGGRDYANIAPGDAIFFDWDLDGSADHVGLVVGTDGSRVYTVEGNSGDACKIKSYPLTYECIKGYGLMNW